MGKKINYFSIEIFQRNDNKTEILYKNVEYYKIQIIERKFIAIF